MDNKYVFYLVCVWMMGIGFGQIIKPLFIIALEKRSVLLGILFFVVIIFGLVAIVNFGFILYGKLP